MILPNSLRMPALLFSCLVHAKKLIYYAVLVLLTVYFNLCIIQLAYVHGPSMKPTVKHMSVVFISRFLYTPKNGDIVIFDSKSPFGISAIKRIIAIGGQNVRIANGKVYLDNELLIEHYLYDKEWRSINMSVDVPEDCVFVMGDNRHESKDSRNYGCIPAERIIGKVLWVARNGTD